MSYAARMAKAWHLADVFNQQVPVGTGIKIKNEAGKEIECKIASDAYALPDGSINTLIQRPGGAVASFRLEIEECDTLAVPAPTPEPTEA